MIGPAHQQWRGLIGPAVQAGSRQSAANTGWQRGIGPSGLEGKHDRGGLRHCSRSQDTTEANACHAHTHTHTPATKVNRAKNKKRKQFGEGGCERPWMRSRQARILSISLGAQDTHLKLVQGPCTNASCYSYFKYWQCWKLTVCGNH